MKIYPELDIYDRVDRERQKEISEFFFENLDANKVLHRTARLDFQAEAGNVSLSSNYWATLGGKYWSFPHIRPLINVISGKQIQTRNSVDIKGRENSDSDTADQLAKVITCISQTDGMPETCSDGYRDSAICGISYFQLWIDFRNDPMSGDIKLIRRPLDSVIVDPYFQKKDGSDCRAIFSRSYITPDEGYSLFPDYKDILEKLPTCTGRDDKFGFMPESISFRSAKNNFMLDEWYYLTYRKAKYIIDNQTLETYEWTSTEDGLREFLSFAETGVSVVDSVIPTVKMSVSVQGKEVYDGKNSLGIDEHVIFPHLTYFSPSLEMYEGRIQGVVTQLKDTQYLYNQRKVIELDILATQKTTGGKYVEGALNNEEDLKEGGQGSFIEIKRGHSMEDFQMFSPPPLDPSIFTVSQGLEKEMNSISGIQLELQGASTEKGTAGITELLRQNSSLVALEPIFDNINKTQQVLGQKILRAIQVNYSPGKVERIIEEEPTDQFYNKVFGKYDAIVTQGVHTISQQQMSAATMLELYERGILGPECKDLILEILPLANKSKILKVVSEANQQASQMAAQQQESEMKEQGARINLSEAHAFADEGLGVKRFSEIDDINALGDLRRSEASKDDALTLFHIAELIKKMAGMDIEQRARLIEISKNIENTSPQTMAGEGVVDSSISDTGVRGAQAGGAAQKISNNKSSERKSSWQRAIKDR